MGRDLYDPLVAGDAPRAACRVYAPVGGHAELLPYLVRRLLENGANTSFVHRLVDERLPLAEIVRDPVAEVAALESVPHPAIVDPPQLFGATRRNSAGLNLADMEVLAELRTQAGRFATRQYIALPTVAAAGSSATAAPVLNPAWHEDVVGSVVAADAQAAAIALAGSGGQFPRPGTARLPRTAAPFSGAPRTLSKRIAWS